MKKGILIVLSCLMLWMLTGCTSNESLKEENEKLQEEIATLKETIQQFDVDPDVQDVQLSGDFTVSVYQICSDYETMDPEYRLLVVSLFQGRPFLLRVTNDVASQLEIDEAYTFTIDDTITVKNVINNNVEIDNILSNNSEKISFVGAAKEDECGLNSDRIQREVIE